jgi:hypothetical protein
MADRNRKDTLTRLGEGGLLAGAGLGLMKAGEAVERVSRTGGRLVGRAGALAVAAGAAHAVNLFGGSAKADERAAAPAAPSVPELIARNVNPEAQRVFHDAFGDPDEGEGALAAGNRARNAWQAPAAAAFLSVARQKEALRTGANETQAPAAPAAPASGLMKAAEVGLSTYASVTAAQILANPAARAAASTLSKALVPVTVGLAAYQGLQGFQQDGLKGAATGVLDSLTGGGFSLAVAAVGRLSGTPDIAPVPAGAAERLAVARAAGNRVAGEMGTTTTLNQGSARTAAAEVESDGMTDDYTRRQNGRIVRVSGYQTPSR